MVITAEYDPLRDEGDAYAARLASLGVPTSHVRFSGMYHGFFVLADFLDDAAAAQPPGRRCRRPGTQPLSALGARANTASSIGSVSRPVNVFCWLGWNEQSSVQPVGRGDLDAVAELRAWPHAELGARRLVGERAEAHHDAQARSAARARVEERRGTCRARRAAACCPAARTSPTAVTHAPVSGSPSSIDTDVGWLARPARCIARYRQSPERSPVNTRPVRLAPWAAGASPSTSDPAPRIAEARAPAAPQ